MILSEKVWIMMSGKNKHHFESLNYKYIYGEKTLVKVEHLQKNSAVKIDVKCDACGFEKSIQYVKYIQNTKNFTEMYCCCPKCAVQKQKDTMINRYGVETSFQLEEFKEKSKKTCLEKYGVENPFQSEEIKNKIKETNLGRYGVENPFHVEKFKKTCLEKYGVENPFQSEEIKDKIKETNLDRYGVENPIQNKDIYSKVKKTMFEKYGEEYNSKLDSVKEKKIETCLKNHGTKFPMQNRKIFEKGIKTRLKINKFKTESDLTYQGSYEKYFLELMQEKGLLDKVSNGKTYIYSLNEKEHYYHSDYLFSGITIEIKSSWTYNKNGKDKELELENETKWSSVRDYGDPIIILFSKKEIKKYVDNL
jgi:hypothetical protein